VECPLHGKEYLEVHRRNFIKRIVGLPGERVSIRGGNVYIDGQISPKPPSIQSRMWLPVYDSRFAPQDTRLLPWQFGRHPWQWHGKGKGGKFTLDALGSSEGSLMNLDRPIVDRYGYNAAGLTRHRSGRTRLHHVADCRVSVRATPLERGRTGRAALLLKIRGGKQEFEAVVPLMNDEQAVLRRNGEVVDEVEPPSLPLRNAVRATLELYDGQVFVYLDGELLLSHAFLPSPTAPERATEVGFGGRDARLQFDDILVQRDVYYLNKPGISGPYHTYEMGPKEYFVLGDNSPQSSDSRYWPDPAVPQENLVGRAFFAFWPLHRLRALSWGTHR
jgi:hypothetical protein